MTDARMVMDAGPLILLAKIDSLPILTTLPFRYVAPPNVTRELAAGSEFGHPPVDAPWLEVCELRESLPPYARMTLDEGEAAAIQLALEQDIGRNIGQDGKAPPTFGTTANAGRRGKSYGRMGYVGVGWDGEIRHDDEWHHADGGSDRRPNAG